MRRPLLFALPLAVSACPGRLPFDSAEQVPDFALEDRNTASASCGQSLSPRGMLGAVSAWYFGHST